MNEPKVMIEMLRGPAGAKRTLAGSRPTLAVVGLSNDPARPSYAVSAYMQQHGFRILPVNPGIESALGERSYASLRELPERPDVVNVFRLPRFIPEIVDEMLELGLKDLWVQLGIRHPEAAARAEAGGIRVVMDRCILIEHRRMLAG